MASPGRIETTFLRLAREKRKLLAVYLCVGDPSQEESLELARACVAAGADLLELGVPFSDPTADGPAIARASQRALKRGGGLDATLSVARAVRAGSDAPIVLFGYYNPLFVRGEDRAVEQAAAAGVDALLVVDLPLEEGAAMRRAAAARGLCVVPLLAPTSSPERVSLVQTAGKVSPLGFLYYVSVTGVTGSGAIDARGAATQAATLKQALGLPVVVGFGIDSPDKARAAAEGADGVVVGTALVRILESEDDAAARRAKVARFVGELRARLDQI